MVFDISPEPFREVSDHLTFVHSAHRRPPLPLVIPHPLPERRWQVSPPHPPLYVPHLQLHRLFLWRSCMQKHLYFQNSNGVVQATKLDTRRNHAWNMQVIWSFENKQTIKMLFSNDNVVVFNYGRGSEFVRKYYFPATIDRYLHYWFYSPKHKSLDLYHN